MKTIETFISEDGEKFNDALSCAEHEFKKIPDILEKINKFTENMPPSHQLRWCGGGPCGCMGCSNHEFRKAGLDESHHTIWIRDYRKPTLADHEYNYSSYTYKYELFLQKNSNFKRSDLALFFKNTYFFREDNLTSIMKKIDNSLSGENSLIYTDSYSDSLKYQKLLKETLNIETIMKRDGQTLDEVISKKKLKP